VNWRQDVGIATDLMKNMVATLTAEKTTRNPLGVTAATRKFFEEFSKQPSYVVFLLAKLWKVQSSGDGLPYDEDGKPPVWLEWTDGPENLVVKCLSHHRSLFDFTC
jgi:hypothetical protein